ncbi:xanthine dehydrogenase accessory protein XdhC [Hydrogenophaga sp.]|jgi:xanthine dehydrogenase accessory factor|uniref:xanthine dehydrogenase accessory protein XdhC n=1 Tax=Hydrogenophaga sp. TaxID=1904254 RepID=UPI00271D5C5B|nr:xanthine dehydrogenase accessory protein XdhC [Hydrogenophaga sp.]MDO9253600.1 xanthine dehydrogenase accessory protein XdhC [Hydrogenophaga sp.]MDP3325821.1 xanthine dehydrogenase accessory protein XdhC [Hydrogenophaga sp.]MDP3888303.1 xanthine dehydrogenase accessory protein XdhC [Hydrogenophaga sp.]MDZ4361285.1 xanthine dehydrogenase accessory protein XdhC [Variovorax sp.]
MTPELDGFLRHLALAPAVLVSVSETRGSVPRERGAWMAVFGDTQVGTIGGGQLEWNAVRQARERLALTGHMAGGGVWEHEVALGPSLGQCCGGRVRLRFEPVQAADVTTLRQRLSPRLTPLALFGGGHVGRAIVQALAPLPFEVTWIDSRDEVFPDDWPPQVHAEHSDPVQAAVGDLAPGSMLLIMSFSHAEDLDIVAACLQRHRTWADLPFVGLIGSQTKWASFRHRLAERGFSDAELAHVTCPIGLPGIAGKEPAVIAASVVAQLLLVRSGAVKG